VDASAIRERQDAVQSLLDDVDLLSNVQEVLIVLAACTSFADQARQRQAVSLFCHSFQI